MIGFKIKVSMMIPEFEPKRAAQVAAFFAIKEGGSINVLKLAKLLYLAERKHMELYDEPMIYDRLVSMDHGPVTSITLNLVNGNSEHEDWSRYISDRSNYEIGLSTTELNFSDLDDLSRSDINLLEALWQEFGDMNKYQIRDYTHEHCPEWENPHGSSLPIPYERVLKFLGKTSVESIVNDISTWRATREALEACR